MTTPTLSPSVQEEQYFVSSDGVYEGICIAYLVYSRGLIIGGKVKAPWGLYVSSSEC